MEMVISIQELREVLSTVQLNARRIRHELRDASIRFQRIKESDVMFGRTKDAIDQVIENQHIPILRALYEAYRLLEKEVQRMLNAAREQTSEWDDTGFIREAAIDTISGRRYYGKGLSGYAAEKLEYDQEFKSIYFYLEDVLSLEMPNNYEYDEHIASLEDDLQDIRNRLRYFRFDMTPFRDLIGKINREINRLEGTVDQPFTDPERMRISGRIEFRASTQVLHAASIQARTEKIESLLIEWDGQDPAEVFANLSRPLSEAEVLAWSIFTGDVEGLSPEERMAVGRDQRNNGIIMIGGGMLLIIFTKGKATPFVAKYFQGASATTIATATSGFKLGGYSFGGGSIAFGASEVGEGLHNIELGSEGDVFSPASNFLRDNVFGGDQSLYNAFKNDVSAVTTIANLTLITIPSLKQRPAPTPPPPSNTRTLSNGRTLRTTNDFAGFRGNIRSVNAPQMRNVNGQWVRVPPPRTVTLSNGRVVRLETTAGTVTNGNIQNADVPHMRNVNGQWVRVPPPSNTRILNNGRRLRTTNDFAGYRGDFRNPNLPRMNNVNGDWTLVRPKVVNVQTYSSWNQMKEFYRGHWTSWWRGNKPKGSPDIDKWFRNGGTITIETFDNGTYVWRYTKNGITVSYVPKVINGQLQNVVQFPESVMFGRSRELATVNIGSFSGNSAADRALAREMFADMGITDLRGYAIHHGARNGEMQLIIRSIHEQFRHYGGHYFYSQ